MCHAAVHASGLSVAKHGQGKPQRIAGRDKHFHICISEGVNRIIICVRVSVCVGETDRAWLLMEMDR